MSEQINQELLTACKMLVKTHGDASWLHYTNGSCSCKSCAKEFAKEAIKKAESKFDKGDVIE